MRLFILSAIVVAVESCRYGPLSPQEIAHSNLKVLVKDASLEGYFAIDSAGVSLFRTPEDKAAGKIESRLLWQEAEDFALMAKNLPNDLWLQAYRKDTAALDKKLVRKSRRLGERKIEARPPDKPLTGIRIAIDPGHLGGSMATAEMEARYIKALSPQGDTLQFNEGTLAWLTAKALESMLTAQGAQVLMTRRAPGYSALGKTFTQWLRTDFEKDLRREHEANRLPASLYKILLKEKDSTVIFNRFFKAFELRQRAHLINTFGPDATVIIHYNADQDSWERRNEAGFYTLIDNNYSMAFVPGAFMKGELTEERDRAEFMRLLITQDLAESIRLSRLVLEKHYQKLGIPPVTPAHGVRYLHAVCLPTEAPGVYARNMSLTRYVKGPICYGESFCQDERKIAIELAKNDTLVAGHAMPKILVKVAEAYYEALVEFFAQAK